MTNSVPPPKKPKHTDDCIYPCSVVSEKPIMPAIPPTSSTIKEKNFINDFLIAIIALIIILGPVSVAVYYVSGDRTLMFLIATAAAYLISKPYFEKLARRIA